MDGPEALAILGDARPIHAYEPFSQLPDVFLDNAVTSFGRDVRVAVRTTGNAATLAAPLRAALGELDPQLAVARIATMDERLGDTVASRRFGTFALAAFAALALLLAAIGLYGLLAFTVSQRRREIAVRMALGARRRSVVGMVVGQGLRLAVVGLALGLLGAAAATRLMSTLLVEVDRYDPVTFVAVPIALGAIALAASALPAWRAVRVRPLAALRLQ